MSSKSGVVIEWVIPNIQKRKLPKATDIMNIESFKKKNENKRGTLQMFDVKKNNEDP